MEGARVERSGFVVAAEERVFLRKRCTAGIRRNI